MLTVGNILNYQKMFDRKMTSCQYRNSQCIKVRRSYWLSYLYNGNPSAWKEGLNMEVCPCCWYLIGCDLFLACRSMTGRSQTPGPWSYHGGPHVRLATRDTPTATDPSLSLGDLTLLTGPHLATPGCRGPLGTPTCPLVGLGGQEHPLVELMGRDYLLDGHREHLLGVNGNKDLRVIPGHRDLQATAGQPLEGWVARRGPIGARLLVWPVNRGHTGPRVQVRPRVWPVNRGLTGPRVRGRPRDGRLFGRHHRLWLAATGAGWLTTVTYCDGRTMGFEISWDRGHQSGGVVSTAQCKTVLPPLLMQKRYCSLALSHRYISYIYIVIYTLICYVYLRLPLYKEPLCMYHELLL